MPVPGAPVTTILLKFKGLFLNYIYTKLNYSIHQFMSDEEFYPRFLKNLKISQKWPGNYMFKFIVKQKENNIEDVKDLFKGMKPTFLTKKSSKNNFISLSVSLEMQNPESVIKVYKKVSKFKGVIAL